MPEATHVASGKVREIYALDDDRLLLVASDRISTFDVDPPDGDPGQGPRAHRALRLLVHAPARRSSRITCSRSATTAARWSAAGSRCCRSSASCAATSPARAGRTTRRPARRRATRCPKGCASRTSCPSRSSRRRRRRRPGHDENITRDEAAELVGAERLAEVERVCIALYTTAAEHARDARHHHRRHEVRARPRRRRQARARRRGAHARLVALLARGHVRAGPRAGQLRQAVRPRLLRADRLGQDRSRARSCPTDVVAHTRSKYIEAFERLTTIPFESYLESPNVVLG